MKDGFPYLGGLSRSTLESLARESFEATLKNDLFPRRLSLCRSSAGRGARSSLPRRHWTSSSRRLRTIFGVDGVLATALEFKDGVCTGRLEGVPMFRREKKDRVLAYAATRNALPAECGFYSDSIYDLPLLESVGRPVAVNPDIRLRRIARARRWPIMDLARSRPAR